MLHIGSLSGEFKKRFDNVIESRGEAFAVLETADQKMKWADLLATSGQF